MGRELATALLERGNGSEPSTSPDPANRVKAGPPTAVVAVGAFFSLLFVASLFVNGATIGTVVLALLLGAGVIAAGARWGRATQVHWLAAVVATGFLAKLVGAGARYWVLVNLYRSVGDATGYHGKGLTMADTWRSLSIPEFGTGTDFVPPVTGLLYVPYKPTMLGGFFIFATLAFVGQLLMLAAFRYVSDSRRFKWYAVAILFTPTIVYWPSSIGKESLMFLFIGPVAYGVARLLSEYRLRWGIPIVIGLLGAAAVRAHIALLLAGGLVLALVLAKAPAVKGRFGKRLLLFSAAAVVVVAAIWETSQRFGLDLSAGISADALTEEVDPFLSDLSERTDTGGSAVEGSVISSPADVPEALIRVLFRPLPWEATNMQTLVAALEGGVLLALFVARLPWILSSLLRLRRRPYALFALMYTGGFVFAFSAMLNLGILTRQRSQVMPFLLVILVDLGLPGRKRRRRGLEATHPEPDLEPVG